MNSSQLGSRPARTLYPFPAGWFALGFSSELRPGQLQTRRFMGQELVLFRTASGQAVAGAAFCPHLGAHLGRGGAVLGETLRCPFHHFQFGPDGRCIFTPYGKAAPPTRLRVWPLRERHGLLLVYHDHEGREPEWEIPAYDTAGWSKLYHRVLRARTHPQETTENGVDLGHFTAVHGYEGVELNGFYTQGPYMRSQYVFHRRADFLGRGTRKLRVEFTAHIHGLGYSVVEAYVPAFDLHTRQFILATPTDGEFIELRLALSLRQIERSAAIHRLLGPIPASLITRLIAWSTFRGFVSDVRQDFRIWEHKQYLQPPGLADGDGPIGHYRKWARQFYPDAATSQAEQSSRMRACSGTVVR